MGKGIA
jgi:hypothetical protein